jgi:hypothetical protein
MFSFYSHMRALPPQWTSPSYFQIRLHTIIWSALKSVFLLITEDIFWCSTCIHSTHVANFNLLTLTKSQDQVSKQVFDSLLDIFPAIC